MGHIAHTPQIIALIHSRFKDQPGIGEIIGF
jgi:hypothetical protein